MTIAKRWLAGYLCVKSRIHRDGTAAAADGTKFDLYEENLISEYHIRYGGYGGIAYHHVADTYIALFSHFIPCGVWEAVYIIDGLLNPGLPAMLQQLSAAGRLAVEPDGPTSRPTRTSSLPE